MATTEGAEVRGIDSRSTFWSSLLRASWLHWVFAVLLLLIAAGLIIITPVARRVRAIQYFESGMELRSNGRGCIHRVVADSWAPRLGEFGVGLHEVSMILDYHATDETLFHVGVLNEVPQLSLIEEPARPITNRGLAALSQLNQLEIMGCLGPGFTDEAMAPLIAANPRLTNVVLINTCVGRQTLMAVAACPDIWTLEITSRSLNDECFRDLPPLPELNSIIIRGLGDQGAAWLARSPELECIYVVESDITGEGLQSLTSLSKLRELHLLRCLDLTPHDLVHLSEGCELSSLGLSSNLVTVDSVEFLLAAAPPPLVRPHGRFLPDLEIYGEIADFRVRDSLKESWDIYEGPALSEQELWDRCWTSYTD